MNLDRRQEISVDKTAEIRRKITPEARKRILELWKKGSGITEQEQLELDRLVDLLIAEMPKQQEDAQEQLANDKLRRENLGFKLAQPPAETSYVNPKASPMYLRLGNEIETLLARDYNKLSADERGRFEDLILARGEF